MDRVRIALAGVGGFGHAHIAAVQALAQEGLVEFVAYAEPDSTLPAATALSEAGLRSYPDFDAMVGAEPSVDLVILCTPIHLHFDMAKAAFSRGWHVFLEKPPVLRIQDLRELVTLQKNTGMVCAVNFCDVARPAIVALKRAICDGVLGRVRQVRAASRCRRTERYYHRNAWAGKTKVEARFVLDGPINNSNAHSLNLAAYLTDTEFHEFALPLWVQAELYRANPIDGEDTSCLKAGMETGAEALVHLTQCAEEGMPRLLTVIGEKGTAEYADHGVLTVLDRPVECPEAEAPTTTILRRMVEVISGSDEPLLMPLAECEGFVLLANGAYESAGRIVQVPQRHVQQVETPEGTLHHIVVVEETIASAHERGLLFSEAGVPWSVDTQRFELEGYDSFTRVWRG